MPDLKYTIVTTADLKGTTAATDATKKLGASVSDTTKEVSAATISKGKLSLAVQKLSHEFPVLGAIAGALKHPIVGLAVAIGLLVREIFKQIEAQDKLAESGAATAASLTQLLTKLNTSRADAVKAAEAQQELADALGKVNEAASNAEKAMDRQIKQIDVRLKQQTKEIENAENIALAELELVRVRESLSDEEFERRRGGIVERFAGLRGGAEAGAEVQKQDVMAKAHFKALEDRKNAVALAEDLIPIEGAAQKKLDEFDRQEAAAAKRRADDLKAEEDKEKEAIKGVTSAQSLLERFPLEPETSPLAIERNKMNVAALALKREQGKLSAAQAAQRSLQAVGQERIGQRDELAADLARTTKLRREAISAAAAAGTRAETTRVGVLDSVTAERLRAEQAKRDAEVARQLAELKAQTAAAKALADEGAETRKQLERAGAEQKRTNSEIENRFKSAANKTP